MNEWWLIGLLGFLTLVASGLLIYPLRGSRFGLVLIVPFICVLAISGYISWGGFAPWSEHLQQDEARVQAEAMLKTIKSPQEIIDKIRKRLEQEPDSAKGWFLLGRLYTSQNQNEEALTAFAKAYQLQPSEEQYAVHYAHSLWVMNHREFNTQIRALFTGLLSNNPNQADALAMLAMDAYSRQDYPQAIRFWEQLLRLAPERSEEAAAIRKAIVKAQNQIDARKK